MKIFVTVVLIFTCMLFFSGFQYAQESNPSSEPESNSDDSGSDDSGSGSVVLGVVLIAALVVMTYFSYKFGWMTTQKSMDNSSKKKEKKEADENIRVATAIFNEASSAHGDKTNIDLLARCYYTTPEAVVDTIATLSSNNRIDIDRAMVDESSAKDALMEINRALYGQMITNPENHINFEKILKKMMGGSDILNRVLRLSSVKTLEIANYYRLLYN